MTIDLSISGLSVSLRLFDSEDYPRIAVDTGTAVAYTATGTAVGTGAFHETLHMWDINAYCDAEQQKMLRLIWAEYDYLRRSLQPCDITISDRTQLFEERVPRTRALATGTTAAPYPATGTATHVLYYPKFKVWMNQKPKFSRVGLHTLASFTLYETVKVAA